MREQRFGARRHDEKIDLYLDTYACATIWQLSDACGMKGNTIYSVLERMRSENRIRTFPLDRELGRRSPTVVVRKGDPRGWDEYRLELVDIRIQATDNPGTWMWLEAKPHPRISRDGVVLPVVSALPDDDFDGCAGTERLRATGGVKAVFSDPNRARAREVWLRSRELGLSVSLPSSFRERTHPRRY